MTTKYQILDLAKNISNISKKIFEQRVKAVALPVRAVNGWIFCRSLYK